MNFSLREKALLRLPSTNVHVFMLVPFTIFSYFFWEFLFPRNCLYLCIFPRSVIDFQSHYMMI